MKDLISVIIPAYNAEKYIEKCIQSILEQTYRDFELLIIDDGSVDNTAAICVQYAQIDARIRYLFQENAGVSAARNYGLRESRGQYIAFVDSDDWIDIHYLEVLYETIYDNDLAMCGYFIQSENECKRIVEPELYHLKSIEPFVTNEKSKTQDGIIYSSSSCGYVWRTLLRKSVILSGNLWFNEKLFYCEDLLFLLQYILLIGCNKVHYNDRSIYTYYQHDDSALAKKYKINLDDNYLCLNSELVKLIMKSNITPSKKAALVSAVDYRAVSHIIKNESERVQGKYLAATLRELKQKKLSLMVNWSAIRQALFDGELKCMLKLLLLKCKFYRVLSFIYRFKPE